MCIMQGLRIRWMGVVALLLAATSATALLAAEARYVARFSDGSRHEGNALTNWHDDSGQPQLEGRSLLEAGNPFRWLRDRTQSPGPEPNAYLEMVTGDRLPGSVVSYQSTGEWYDPAPAHFVVEPQTPLRPQQAATHSTVRVLASYVKRIVWQRREAARFQPNSLLMRDGRTINYRAIRFDDGFVSILAAEGNQRIAFQEIAEAHLSPGDFWQRYLEELAVLSPEGTSRLYQLETTDGLIVTGSKERLAIYHHTNAGDPKYWVHGLQPAWSLDILWIPNEKVWLRRSFAPHEVPLSRLPVSNVEHRSVLSRMSEPVRRDRNLEQEPLRSGGKEWGFGLGTTTTTEIAFELPPGAKSLRGSIGLDRLAGKGGCARGEILIGAATPQKIWESPVLVGSEAAHDFGPLSFPAPAESQRLILRADAMHVGRPAGADPFEVRDFVDWLDPILEFDAAVLQATVREKLTSAMPVWSQWNVALPIAADKPPKFESFRDKFAASPGRFRFGTILEQPLALTRRLALSPQDQWLVMHVSRPVAQGSEPRLEVRIGGELVGDFKVPLNEGQVRPLAVPLLGYHGGQQAEIDVQLTLHAEANAGSIEWRSLRTAEQLPFLYRVFEEENRFAPLTGEAPTLDKGEPTYGVKALRMAAGSSARIEFDRPLRIRDNPTAGEYRLFRFHLQKHGKGHVLVEFEGQGDRGPRRALRVGPLMDPPPEQVALQDAELTQDWIMFQRDLFSDLGSFDIHAITLHVPDGEYALWDHIYLAGRWDDLEQILKAPSPELLHRKVDAAVTEELLAAAKPFVVLVDFGDGRIGNAVITKGGGEMLSAGHLVQAPNRDVTITLPDGSEVQGKTLGIAREFNLGMLKIDPAGSYQALGMNTWAEPSTQHYYLALSHAKGKKVEEPEAKLVDLRRVFQGTLWTTYRPANGLCGGALVNKEKQLAGILTRYSPFGGAEYASMQKVNEIEERLRNGEVWGKWRDGTGPALGFSSQPHADGAKVTAIEPGGPAAEAGLMAGDLVTKFDSQATRGPADIFAAIAERDPGHEATLEVLRNGQPVALKLKLAPRMP
jgi:S1-C subfamily serine protease